MNFKNAIVIPPARSFHQGITSAEMGLPDIVLARDQHQAYCTALESCAVSLTLLQADDQYPDSTFVEDTAVLTNNCAILANPGAANRRGEVVKIKSAVANFFDQVHAIQPRGTLDGGDICQAGNHFFIGISNSHCVTSVSDRFSYLSIS